MNSRTVSDLHKNGLCICQLCTCGRHFCPNIRNASHIKLGSEKENYIQERGLSSLSNIVPCATEVNHNSSKNEMFTRKKKGQSQFLLQEK